MRGCERLLVLITVWNEWFIDSLSGMVVMTISSCSQRTFRLFADGCAIVTRTVNMEEGMDESWMATWGLWSSLLITRLIVLSSKEESWKATLWSWLSLGSSLECDWCWSCVLQCLFADSDLVGGEVVDLFTCSSSSSAWCFQWEVVVPPFMRELPLPPLFSWPNSRLLTGDETIKLGLVFGLIGLQFFLSLCLLCE